MKTMLKSKAKTLLNKFLDNLLSLKVWGLMLATSLLLERQITKKEWIAAFAIVFGLRELSELRQNVVGGKTND